METFIPALYVVATPIGNRDDISLRALALLKSAEIIACEDTRHSRLLLDYHGIAPSRLIALHEHNEQQVSAHFQKWITAGNRVALLTDAGTPAISDPGARAVATVRAAGLTVVPLPGASALTTALSASGLGETSFFFAGFLPPRSSARCAVIRTLADIPAILAFYEAPHRMAETLRDLTALLGDARTLVIARELTKRFEQIAAMRLGDSVSWLHEKPEHARGEFVLLLGPPILQQHISPSARKIVEALLEDNIPASQAVRLAARITGESKKQLYRFMAISNKEHT